MNYITFVDFKTAELLGPMAVSPTGSRYTCFPAVTNTDADFIVECLGDYETLQLVDDLKALGWYDSRDSVSQEMRDAYADVSLNFVSLKHPSSVANLIITGDAEFARRWRGATEVSKRLNLLDRNDRVVLFRAIRDGIFPE